MLLFWRVFATIFFIVRILASSSHFAFGDAPLQYCVELVQANFIWVGVYNSWCVAALLLLDYSHSAGSLTPRASLSLAIGRANDMNKNSSYLTHWTLAVVTAYFLLATIVMVRAEAGKVRSLDFWSQLTMLTGETALAMSPVVVLVYWTLLYGPSSFKNGNDLWANIFYHGARRLH